MEMKGDKKVCQNVPNFCQMLNIVAIFVEALCIHQKGCKQTQFVLIFILTVQALSLLTPPKPTTSPHPLLENTAWNYNKALLTIYVFISISMIFCVLGWRVEVPPLQVGGIINSARPAHATCRVVGVLLYFDFNLINTFIISSVWSGICLPLLSYLPSITYFKSRKYKNTHGAILSSIIEAFPIFFCAENSKNFF